MIDRPATATRSAEARLLAEAGQAMFGQQLRVTVTLPASLAERLAQVWQRDDTDPVTGESEIERRQRHQAGHAALIGLAITERGRELPMGLVEIALDAWEIGAALQAADELGLLGELPSGPPETTDSRPDRLRPGVSGHRNG